MTTTNETTEISSFGNAQLYWDDQDPTNVGWVLRWRDERGDEIAFEVGCDKSADLEALASEVALCAPEGATGDIAVYRGDRKSARISICDGAIMGWRAL